MRAAPPENAIRGAFFGAITGDALCLGTHYEYDAEKIFEAYGRKPIDRYYSPGEATGGATHGVGWGERNYHPGKSAGGTTDNGDYNILVLEYLARCSGNPPEFEVASLIPHWKERLENNWGSWICTMTRETYGQAAQGVAVENLGGMSNAMAIRHVAAHASYDDEDLLVEVARKAMFTHRAEEALGGGEFFARVTHRVIQGAHPRKAISEVADLMDGFFQDKALQGIAKADEVLNGESPLAKELFCDDLALTSMARLWDVGRSEPIKVGKASPTEGTLPGSVYLILKYVDEDEGLKKALQANAMIGGDNASRAIAIGMVLGAYFGIEAIPQPWLDGLEQYEYCEELLEKLPLLQS